MKTEAGNGVMHPRENGPLQPPGAGRGRKALPCGLGREPGSAHTWILGFGLQTVTGHISISLSLPACGAWVGSPRGPTPHPEVPG